MSTFVAAKDVPLRFGQPEDFNRCREFFRSAGFDEAALRRTLSVRSMSDIRTVQWDTVSLDAAPGPLRWCVQVFLRGLAVSEQESRAVCGDAAFASFIALGLLRPAKKDPTTVVSPVWLYPCDSFVVVSDRTDDPDGGRFQPGEDVVFPAIYGGTLRFLQLLPDACGGDALDLCGGSGIGALHFARTARSATTADVAERSAVFADFNGRLNGVQMASACGDLYEPVAGRQFDVISAHPPFVPALGPNMVYRDGGDTGEEITRRIIAGLPAYLRPGGTAVILCVARDATEENFEQRVRGWLGEQGGQFDIVFGCEKILTVNEVAESLQRGGKNSGGLGLKEISDRLRSFGTRQFVYGATFIRRLRAGVAQKSLRLTLASQGGARDFLRVLRWREIVRLPDFAARLAASRPRLAEKLELNIRHIMQGGELTPAEFTFSIDAGFEAVLRPDGWIVPLVARLDGQTPAQQVFDRARAADELPPGFPLEAFLDLVRQMVERGFLISELIGD